MHTFKEALFPTYYREQQVRRILSALARRRSIFVCGLAGMGKSNVLRFLAAHPKARTRYLGARARQFTFGFVDCNRVDASSQTAVLEELDAQLARAGLGDAANPTDARPRALAQLKREVAARVEALAPTQTLVVIFDPFDEGLRELDKTFFTFLRALRDPGANLAFVFGARRPPTAPLAELQELFVETCWVGPLTTRDALDSLRRDETRLHARLAARVKKQVVDVTGRHSGLLKNGAEWAAALEKNAAGHLLGEELLRVEAVQNICEELWADFTPAEKRILKWASAKRARPIQEEETTRLLTKAGVLTPHARGGWNIFSKIFEEFVRAQFADSVTIGLGGSNQVSLEAWQGTIILALPPLRYQLLERMARDPQRAHTFAELAGVLGGGGTKHNHPALEKHIERLRRALNPPFRKLRALSRGQKWNAILSVRNVGYQLNCAHATQWQIQPNKT